VRARRARPEDVAGVHRLIAHYAAKGLLLPRSEDEIRAHIRRFLVLAEKQRPPERPTENLTEKLLGCVSLEPYGEDLAEVRSLAVDPAMRGRGVGTRLLQVALAAARRRRIARVFAVTHAPEFFSRQGFAASTRWALPDKLARDCCTCPKASHCDLSAVIASVCPEQVTLPVLAATQPVPAPSKSGQAL
jgi:amino-acid N-acetyltransferase